MVEGERPGGAATCGVGEAVVDAADRLAAFDESFAQLVHCVRGSRPRVGELIATVVGDAHARVVVAAVAGARLHGRTMTVLRDWSGAGEGYELDLTWAESPETVRMIARPLSAASGVDDALFAAAVRSNTTEMISIFDVDSKLRAYNPLYARAAESVLGRPITVGESLRDLIRPLSLARLETLVRRALAGESILEDFPVVGVAPATTFELSLNPVYGPDGTIIGVSIISRNVTRRRQNESTTAAAAAYRRAVLDAMPDAFAILDRAGVIVDVRNPVGFPVPLGISAMLGRNLREFPHLPTERLMPALEAAFATGEVQRIDYELTVDGVVRSRTARISRINDNEALWVVRDVTDDRRASERLAFTDRMVSVGTLAAGVAHELNNPLQYVLGNVEAARERIADRDPDAHAALTEALSGLERASQIVSALKTFSRSGDAKPTSVSLGGPLHTALKFAGHALKTRAVLEVDAAVDAPVMGSETALSQVFLNILLNAVDAVLSVPARTGLIRVRTRLGEGGRVAVEIFNNGPPIPESVRAHIFDPFFTTKPVGQGTGLGLAIALQIVRASGGDITVDSRDGDTTFTVTLPLSDARPRSDAPVSPAVAATPCHGEVLVVDDDLHVARSIVRQLVGYRVRVAGSGEEGLRALEGGRFDVVLCDVMMPGMSGAELYDTVTRKWPGLEQRFVMMTGGVLTDEQRTTLGDATACMLRKPFSRAELRRAVERALAARP